MTIQLVNEINTETLFSISEGKTACTTESWVACKCWHLRTQTESGFEGPIMAENLLRNSWLGLAEKKWQIRHSCVILKGMCYKCLNVHRRDQSLRYYSLALSCPHIFASKQHPYASSASGPPCLHQDRTAVFLLGKHLNYKKPGTELLFH